MYLLMILLQIDQLLLQPFDLHGEVFSGDVELIKQPLQAGNVCFHCLTYGQLGFISVPNMLFKNTYTGHDSLPQNSRLQTQVNLIQCNTRVIVSIL